MADFIAAVAIRPLAFGAGPHVPCAGVPPMAEAVVIGETHITLRVPAGRPDDAAEAARAAPAGADFLGRMRRAARDAVRAVPELNAARVAVAP